MVTKIIKSCLHPDLKARLHATLDLAIREAHLKVQKGNDAVLN